MTFTAMRPGFGLPKGLEVSLLKVGHLVIGAICYGCG